DLALLLDAMAGFDPEDHGSVETSAGPIGAIAGAASLAGVSIGIADALDAVPIDADVRREFDRAIATLEALGATIRRIELPGVDPGATRRAGFLVCEADGAVAHERDLAAWPGAFSPAFRRMLEYGRDAPAAKLVKAERAIETAGFALRLALRG